MRDRGKSVDFFFCFVFRKYNSQSYNRTYKFTMNEKGLMSRISKGAKGNC